MFSGSGVWWCSLKGSTVRSWGWTSSSRSLPQTSVTWTRSQNFGCLFKVTQLPRAARRGWALPKMCLLKMFTELSPKNCSGPKCSLKLRLRTKLSPVTSASCFWSCKQRPSQDSTALDSTWSWAQARSGSGKKWPNFSQTWNLFQLWHVLPKLICPSLMQCK